jgi:hypothetical protein
MRLALRLKRTLCGGRAEIDSRPGERGLDMGIFFAYWLYRSLPSLLSAIKGKTKIERFTRKR